MLLTTKALYVAIPALVGAGVISAVVVNREAKREAGIAAGTVLTVELERPVSTKTSRVGDAVELRTVAPIRLSDGAALPAGVMVRGEVTQSKGGGRVAGAPELALRFDAMEVDGETYAITANAFRVRGKSDAKQSAAMIGGGAVAGGVLGGVLGGGDDVVKGAVVGAAIGTGAAVATDGDDLVLPAGQKLKVRLTGPVTVRYRPMTEATQR